MFVYHGEPPQYPDIPRDWPGHWWHRQLQSVASANYRRHPGELTVSPRSQINMEIYIQIRPQLGRHWRTEREYRSTQSSTLINIQDSHSQYNQIESQLLWCFLSYNWVLRHERQKKRTDCYLRSGAGEHCGEGAVSVGSLRRLRSLRSLRRLRRLISHKTVSEHSKL